MFSLNLMLITTCVLYCVKKEHREEGARGVECLLFAVIYKIFITSVDYRQQDLTLLGEQRSRK